MSDDLSKRRLGRGLAALIGEMDQPVPVGEPQRAVSADRTIRSSLSLVASETRDVISMKMNCRIWRRPFASTVLFSRSSFAPFRPTVMKSSLVSVAGVPHNWLDLPKFRLSFAMSMIVLLLNWRLLKTFSAQTSIRLKRRWVMSN
jgi:hypothetical protein